MEHFRYFGDVEKAKKLVHFGRKQMNILKEQMRLGRIWSDVRRFFDRKSGVEIVCSVMSGVENVAIYVPPTVSVEIVKRGAYIHRYALFALGIAWAPGRTKIATYAGMMYPSLFMLYDVDNEEVVLNKATKDEIEALEEMRGVEIWGDNLNLVGANLSTNEQNNVSFLAVNVDGGRFDYEGSMVLANGVTADVTGYVEICKSSGKPNVYPQLSKGGAYVPRLNFLWSYSDSDEDTVTESTDATIWASGGVADCDKVDTYSATVRHTCSVTGSRGYYVCDPPVAVQVYCYDPVACRNPDGSSYPCYVATFGTYGNESDWFRAAHYEPVTSLRLTDHLGNSEYMGTTVAQHEENGEEVNFNGLTYPYEVYRYGKQDNNYTMYYPAGELLESFSLKPAGTCETWSGHYGGASVYDSAGEDKTYVYLYSSLAKARYMTAGDNVAYCKDGELTRNADVAVAMYFGQYNTLTQEWIGPVTSRQCEFASFTEAEVGNRTSNIKVYMGTELGDASNVSPFNLPHKEDVEGALSAMIEEKYGDNLTFVDNHLDIDVLLFGIVSEEKNCEEV